MNNSSALSYIIFCSIIIVSLISLSPKHRRPPDPELHVKESLSGYAKGNVNLAAIVFSGINFPFILNLPSLRQSAWSTDSK